MIFSAPIISILMVLYRLRNGPPFLALVIPSNPIPAGPAPDNHNESRLYRVCNLIPSIHRKQIAMSTQYDAIGTRYNSMHDLPAIHLERPSAIAALGDISGKRALDLACGTGRYSRLLIELGAASVVGVDISPVMIEGSFKGRQPIRIPSRRLQ